MTIYNQILYVTSFSACFSLLGLVSAGQLMPALAFVSRHPEALASVMMLSGAATVGQLFISHTIKTFGALLFATVMTTRQFISILLSCILFAHPLSGGQWMGTVMVFGECRGPAAFVIGWASACVGGRRRRLLNDGFSRTPPLRTPMALQGRCTTRA